jgi:hypothetical protein
MHPSEKNKHLNISCHVYCCSVANSVKDPDPVQFYPRIRIRDDFFSGSRIPDSYHVSNSIYIQDFTFKNGEKQEKLNFVYNMTSIMTYRYSCMKKVSLFFPFLICRIRIRDKRGRIRIRDTKKWSDPDPG